MMLRTFLTAAIGLSVFVAAPIMAQDAEPDTAESLFVPVTNAGPITLDPDGAYLLVQGFESVVTVFTREASESGRFDGPDADPAATLFIMPYERLSGERGSTLWLYRVPPGNYAYYGRAYMIGGQIGAIDCACLGSVKFAVAPGTVTAVKVAIAELGEDGKPVSWSQRSRDPIDGETRRAPVVGPVTQAVLDPRLAQNMIVDAQLQPVPSLENWAGGTINRVVPIADAP